MARKKTDKDTIEILHDYGVHVETRTIWLESSQNHEGDEDGVNYSMLITFLKNLHLLESINHDPITIVIHTGGGYITDGMAIYDAIKSSPCHITIKVMGIAMSMGIIILQAADHREISEHGRLMFHLGSGHSGGNHIYEAANAVASDISIAKAIDDIIYGKISAKMKADGKKYSRNKYKEHNYNGKFMLAKEALEMGLVDTIIPAK